MSNHPITGTGAGDEALAFINRCLEAYRHAEDEHAENERAYRTEAARLLARHRELQDPLRLRMEAIEREIETIAGEVLPAGKRSRKVHNGTVGWRKAPDRVEIDDAEELRSWTLIDGNRQRLEAAGASLIRVKYEADKKAVLAWIKNEGEVPDSCEVVAGADHFYVAVDRPLRTPTVEAT